MIQYDSKLFYGVELGPLKEYIEQITKVIENPPREPQSILDYIGWVNIELPEGVYLDVTYPHIGCNAEDIIAHINLIDTDEIKIQELGEVDIDKYRHVLKMLGLNYTEPKVYCRHYCYQFK